MDSFYILAGPLGHLTSVICPVAALAIIPQHFQTNLNIESLWDDPP